ncbi:MAG: carbohydrate kinase [Gemmataceae bacterium]
MIHPIVGIGELLWDVYPDGRKVAGGAPFNFAFHCHQLGHPAVIVSRVGNDDLGRELRERVRELGLSDEYIQTDHEHPTGTVQVSLDANAVPTYTITENVAWDFIEWDEKLKVLAERAAAVCFGTLAQRSGTPVTLQRIVDLVRERRPTGLIVFDVNLRGSFFQPLTLDLGLAISDWQKVNEDEFAILEGLTGLRWESSPVGSWLRCGVTIKTRGSEGCEVYHCWEVDDGEGGEYYPDETFTVPGVPAKVVDTVGAGDAFTAAMVCLHLEGKSLRECARFAVHYAAKVCEQPGGTPRIDRQDVERAAFGAK